MAIRSTNYDELFFFVAVLNVLVFSILKRIKSVIIHRAISSTSSSISKSIVFYYFNNFLFLT